LSAKSGSVLVAATRNPDKLTEIRQILAGTGIEVRGAAEFEDVPEVEETGRTLEENALLKARAVYRATGLPTLADDTGLEVDALGGRPGVYSSRFAGETATYADNVRKLLRELESVPPERRTARFRCVVAFVDGRSTHVVEGTREGVILSEQRGSSGFGYDPVFFVPETGKTFAEMTPDEKNRISHRALALGKMKALLVRYFEEKNHE